MLEDISFQTSDPNIIIHIANISIKPNIHAVVEYRLSFRSGGSDKYTITIEGDEYKRWSVDDRYLFIYIANLHNLKYVEKVEPEFIDRIYCLQNEDGSFRNIVEKKKNPIYTGLPPLVITSETIFVGGDVGGVCPPTPATSAQSTYYDDIRSVHNDSDVAKITTLEEQMVEQTKQINQLRSILISKGMI